MKMKKVISAIICALMILAMCTPAFANEFDEAYEVNNTPQQAVCIDMYRGSPIIAAISDNTDVDYYLFAANSTASLNIGLISPSNKNYDIVVVDKLNGNVVGQSSLGSGQTDIATCNVVSGGLYYIIIYGATSSDFYQGRFYQLFKAN